MTPHRVQQHAIRQQWTQQLRKTVRGQFVLRQQLRRTGIGQKTRVGCLVVVYRMWERHQHRGAG